MRLGLRRIKLPLAGFDLAVDVTITTRVTALCGPSGAGKTSLLDLIAGLRRPQTALVQLDEHVLTDTSKWVNVPTRQRRIGYVPQDLALFPHRSVRGNLLYGAKGGSVPADDLFSLDHVTEVLELRPLIERSVNHLSGGEKQRVALGRALLSSPRLLLLDEPLASLDRALKEKILPYLMRIRDEFRLAMLYVTHDIEEASPLCEQILRIEHGQLIVS